MSKGEVLKKIGIPPSLYEYSLTFLRISAKEMGGAKQV